MFYIYNNICAYISLIVHMSFNVFTSEGLCKLCMKVDKLLVTHEGAGFNPLQVIKHGKARKNKNKLEIMTLIYTVCICHIVCIYACIDINAYV